MLLKRAVLHTRCERAMPIKAPASMELTRQAIADAQHAAAPAPAPAESATTAPREAVPAGRGTLEAARARLRTPP